MRFDSLTRACVVVALATVAACQEGAPDSSSVLLDDAPPLPDLGADEVGLAGTSVPSSRVAWRWPFGVDSPWNMPLPNAASLATPGTGDADARCSQQISSTDLWTGLNVDAWTIPVYRGKSSDPATTLYWSPDSWWPDGGVAAVLNAPTSAMPSPPTWSDEPDTDAHLVLVEPNGQTAHEMWRARAGTYHGARAFSFWGHTSTDLLGSGVGAGGERAYGGSALGGLIRKGEVKNGIHHALAFAVPRAWQRCCSPVWPATQVDSGASGTYAGRIPMGALVALPKVSNSTIDTQWGLTTATGKAIARALRDYGGYDVDSSGGVAFYAEPAASAEVGDADAVAADLLVLRKKLRCVRGNTAATPGGLAPSAPRRQPLAPTPSL